MLSVGKFDAEIVCHTIRAIGEKEAVSITVRIGEDETEAMIWMTEKSMGIARQSLKLCGFHPDAMSLCDLEDNPTLLAGKHVVVLVEPYNGRMKASILLNPTPPKARMKELDAALKAAKKNGEDEDMPF